MLHCFIDWHLLLYIFLIRFNFTMIICFNIFQIDNLSCNCFFYWWSSVLTFVLDHFFNLFHVEDHLFQLFHVCCPQQRRDAGDGRNPQHPAAAPPAVSNSDVLGIPPPNYPIPKPRKESVAQLTLDGVSFLASVSSFPFFFFPSPNPFYPPNILLDNPDRKSVV